ncbi:MAG: hypothetical protein A2W00_04635 [Candidatus Eisenbacteria bacterium RBG_16_71_46]|nr:MAG: hypothetical protein A2W00_04635 [Candidatus Eisenbacteria bacterium RBG_16_71_46]
MVNRCMVEIKRANGGPWPETFCEWRRVCRRFGISLLLVRACGSFRAWQVEDVLIIRYTPRWDRMHPWIAHEVTEWLLHWDGAGPPCRFPGDEQECHRIAHLVERELR